MAGTLTRSQIAGYAAAAGFKGSAIDTIVAIILAESGGNPLAHNTNAGTGDNSYGLAQINMLGTLGPARRQQFGISSNDQLFDPATNLRAAYAVSGGGTSWTPWSVYKSGAYRQYLGGGNGGPISGLTGLPLPPNPFDLGGDVAGGALDKVGEVIAGAFGAAVEPFVTGLRRLTIIGIAVVGGVALIVAGSWRGVKAGQ